MDKERFGLIMIQTAAATRSEVDELTISAYWEELSSWSDFQFAEAMKRCRRELTRFPTVAEIIARKPPKKADPKKIAEQKRESRAYRKISDARRRGVRGDEFIALVDSIYEGLPKL